MNDEEEKRLEAARKQLKIILNNIEKKEKFNDPYWQLLLINNELDQIIKKHTNPPNTDKNMPIHNCNNTQP